MKIEHFYPIFSNTFWGITIVGAKILSNFGFRPIEITFIRFLIASLFFIPLLVYRNFTGIERIKLKKSVWKPIFALSLSGVAVNNTIFYIGLERTTAGVASLLVSFNPLMTMVFAVLLLGESLTRKKIISVFLGIFGVTIIIGISGSNGQLIGNLFILLALAIWGASFSFSRLASNEGLSSVAITGISEIIGTIFLIPVILIQRNEFSGEINPEVIFWFIILGILSSVISYVIHYQAIAVLGASTVAPSVNIIPISGAITAWILLGETLSWSTLIGAIIIIIGVFLVQFEGVRSFNN